MYVKLSMKEVHRAALSEHERKRCRLESRGSPWQVYEEDILWWSFDKVSWMPVYDEKWQQRRRRWLMVEAEDGTYPALLWDITEGLMIPSETRGPVTDDEPAYSPATVSDFERFFNR
jgi:hypothetical protein